MKNDQNAGDSNYRNYITEKEAASMLSFMSPLLQVLASRPQVLLDLPAHVGEEVQDFTLGMVLYSRLISAYAGLVALNPLLGPLSAVFKLINEGKHIEAVNALLAEENAVLSIAARVVELCDNIHLTHLHIARYCSENNIDHIQTPYSK